MLKNRLSVIISVLVVSVAAFAASSVSTLCLWFMWGTSKKTPSGLIR